jgi:uncharacterized protein YuzE
MQIKHDALADALYIKLKRGKVAETKEEGPYLVDYDKQGKVLGIEVLDYSEKASAINSKTQGPFYTQTKMVQLLRDKAREVEHKKPRKGSKK